MRLLRCGEAIPQNTTPHNPPFLHTQTFNTCTHTQIQMCIVRAIQTLTGSGSQTEKRRWITSQSCSPAPIMTSTCHNMTILEPGHECRASQGWGEFWTFVFMWLLMEQARVALPRRRVFASSLQTFTFVYRDDVRVAEGRHDLDLSADVNHVVLVLDLLLPNWLDSHLERAER